MFGKLILEINLFHVSCFRVQSNPPSTPPLIEVVVPIVETRPPQTDATATPQVVVPTGSILCHRRRAISTNSTRHYRRHPICNKPHVPSELYCPDLLPVPPPHHHPYLRARPSQRQASSLVLLSTLSFEPVASPRITIPAEEEQWAVENGRLHKTSVLK